MKFSQIIFFAVAVFVCTLLLYAPSLRHDYLTYDDPAFVDPPMIQRGLSWQGLRWSLTATQGANWHPITILSHMADAQLFGNNPAGAHFTNALLHAGNSALVFLALVALTKWPWPSLVVAALFAVHPLHVESVAWVAERKDLLSACFFLLTLLAYARFSRTGGAGSYFLCLILFALGLMSKPMLVTLPCVLLLLDFWPLNRQQRWGRLIAEKVPFFLLAIAASVVTYFVQHAMGATALRIVPPALRIENAIYAYGRYLWKTIWPAKLAIFYPYLGALPGTSIPLSGLLASAIALILISAAAIWLWRLNRAALVGWLWFLGMLVPVIGLVQVGLQSMADRYAYLPHIGLFIAVVFPCAQAIRRAKIPPAVVACVFVPILFALTYRTLRQLATWKDTITVFNHALQVTTHNHVAHNNLAYIYMQDPEKRALAMEHLRAALAINPNLADPYYNMGLLLDASGRHAEAQRWFEQAIERDPRSAGAELNLANTLLAQSKVDDAIVHYRRAVELNGDSFLAHYNLGLALSKRDGDAAALPEFARAAELDPNQAEARYSYAIALRAAGREADANAQFAIAARLAQEQRLDDLLAEIRRQQKQGGALPKATTKTENLR